MISARIVSSEIVRPMLLEARTIALLVPCPLQRLSDRILVAFNQACDQGEREVARALLPIAEDLVRRTPADGSPDRRRGDQAFEAAKERLRLLLGIEPDGTR